MTDLSHLADRLEKAEGADAEAETLIYAAINGWPVEWRGDALVRLTDYYPIGTLDSSMGRRWFSGHIGAPAYTRSLDAAMTLVPDRRHWTVGLDSEGIYAQVAPYVEFIKAATPALALCAAALRARHASAAGEG